MFFNHRYKDFVDGVDVRALENPPKRVTEGFILGDPAFVNWVKETFLYDRKEEKDAAKNRRLT